MSEKLLVVILDGIFTTVCIYMASDYAHEEISKFVDLRDLIRVSSSRSFLAGNKFHFSPT